jgi:hypothetical protein
MANFQRQYAMLSTFSVRGTTEVTAMCATRRCAKLEPSFSHIGTDGAAVQGMSRALAKASKSRLSGRFSLGGMRIRGLSPAGDVGVCVRTLPSVGPADVLNIC